MIRRYALVAAAMLAAFSGCSGGANSVPTAPATTLAGGSRLPFAVPAPPPSLAVPPRSDVLRTTPAQPDRSGRRSPLAAGHPAFFNGENALSNGVYYLQFPSGNVFGYYSYLTDPRYIYHQDLGYAFVADANDGKSGIYLYDFASGHWWYTSPAFSFPYLYDFSRSTVLYYYPDSTKSGRYTANPRYFYDFAAGAIVTLPGPQPNPSRLTFAGGSTLPQQVESYSGVNYVTLSGDASGCAGIASASSPSPWLVITPTGTSGSCSMVVVDPSGGRSVVPIVVSAQPTGSVTTYSHAGNSFQNLAVDASGNLWFAVYFSNEIVRRTPAGSETVFPLASNAQPDGIATGSDGNMWFTEYGLNKIGRITSAGVVTEFTLPTASSQPSAIAQGPDGALWFLEAGHAAVGRITTAGAIAEYPVSSANSQISGITTGPDGNLWFTAYPANAIGRITPAGAATLYHVPNSRGGASSIAAGADGALWFTEIDSGLIGRITVTGTMTEYPRPSTTYDQPYGIAAGPDGNMWYTDFSSSKIGRITTTGYVDEFPVPHTSANAFPNGIARGADGALWFAGNQLGRITP
jgi:streptogramin lyase